LKLSSADALIDQVNYTNDWYKDEVKKDGGYSLELIDPKNKCSGIQNWMASNATNGGTPGSQNSVYQNQLSTIAPQLSTATIIDETTIRLVFSKYVDSLTASLATNYSVNNGLGVATSALPIGPAFTTVEVKLNVPITRGAEHLLTVANVTDCAGNVIDANANTAMLFLAKPIKANDILISEVLVNPKNNGVDYIEIYNNTADVMDLKDLQLANVDDSGKVANIKAVSTTSVFMQPKAYWVLTTKPTIVQEQYVCKYPNQLVQMTLPSYNNDKGTVILLNGEVTIDRFDYSEKMHVPLLKNVDGVALERTSFTKTANEIGNFTSAVQTVGFGTPTNVNSQQQLIDGDRIEVVLSSKTFSPDGDGFEDLLQIDYQLRANNNLATVKVYTDKGVLVRKLQQNTTVPTIGRFVWDGLNDNGQIANVGIYVIKFDVFSPSGKADRITKTCVLAGKF
jgi:flagellar hook assembly protein FlgD